MLAALLLNLGSGPPPPSAPPRSGFGGGPFTSRYGYGREYQSTTTSALPVIDDIELAPVVERPAIQRPKINYRVLSERVAESAAKDMRKLVDQRKQELEDENDEVETILLMNLFGD